MSSTLANSWENHLKDHPSNEASNKALSQLFEIFKVEDEVDRCTTFALTEPNTLFLALAPISGHLLPFHHTTKLGGTRTDPNERFFTLVGTGPRAYPAQIDPNILFASNPPSANPSWKSITDSSDPEALTNLTTNARSPSSPKRNCIPVPPFIASAIMPTDGLSIAEVTFTSLSRIKAFDIEHEGDPSFEIAKDECRTFIYWLLAARKTQLITPTPLLPSVDSQITTFCNTIHTQHIHSPSTTVRVSAPSSSNQALEELTSNIQEQTTVLQKMNSLAEEKGADKRKGSSSLHPSTLKMILAASSEDGIDTPPSVPTSCESFFK